MYLVVVLALVTFYFVLRSSENSHLRLHSVLTVPGLGVRHWFQAPRSDEASSRVTQNVSRDLRHPA